MRRVDLRNRQAARIGRIGNDTLHVCHLLFVYDRRGVCHTIAAVPY
jgi:hypothetical protein